MNNKNILLIIVIIVLISLVSVNVFSTFDPNTPPGDAIEVSSWRTLPNDLTLQETLLVQQNPTAKFKRVGSPGSEEKVFWIPDATNPASYTKVSGGIATPGSTAPQTATNPTFNPVQLAGAPSGASLFTTTTTSAGSAPAGKVNIDIVVGTDASGNPSKVTIPVSQRTGDFIEKNPNWGFAPGSTYTNLKFMIVQDAPQQEFDRWISTDTVTKTRIETIIDVDGNKDENFIEEIVEWDADKKQALTNKPVSKSVINTHSNSDGKVTQQTRNIFEPRGNAFAPKGSVTINLEHGENWFGGAFKSRTSTVIKDASGATLYTIDKDGVIKDRSNAEVKQTSDNIKKIKEELGKIDDGLRQEFTDGVLVSSAPFFSLDKFRAMDWSQFFGGFIKSYNEFAGLAHITNLAFDSDYEEKVAKRKIQNAQRFCALAGIGYCFVSNICDKKIDNIGSSVTITQKGKEHSIGVARISGEKSPLIKTPQGTQYLYTVNFHLENPFDDQTMSYNVYFISSSGQEKKWYALDKTLGKAEVVVVNQASDKSIRKLTKGNYDKVCIRFNPSIYIFGSRRTTNQACDVLTKTPEELTEDQVQSVVNQQGPDGDI